MFNFKNVFSGDMIMRESPGKFGKCQYTDCIEAMRLLPDQSFDFGLTDPPYNVDFDLSSQSSSTGKRDPASFGDKIFYDDTFESEAAYRDFSLAWFTEMKRVCKRFMFTPGNKNLGMWYGIEKPVGIFIHYKPNGMSKNSLACYARWEPILLYGKFNHQFDFLCDVFEVPVENGDKKFVAKHGSPKPVQLYFDIIERAKEFLDIRSVIDPFLGSGTTAEVCEWLNLRWLGLEVKEDYAVDIDRRIELGQAKGKIYASGHSKQGTLLGLLQKR